MTLVKKALQNIVGKGENSIHFLLFKQCFQAFQKTIPISWGKFIIWKYFGLREVENF